MKRLLALLLAVSLMLCLCACGGKVTEKNPDDNANQTTTVVDDTTTGATDSTTTGTSAEATKTVTMIPVEDDSVFNDAELNWG